MAVRTPLFLAWLIARLIGSLLAFACTALLIVEERFRVRGGRWVVPSVTVCSVSVGASQTRSGLEAFALHTAHVPFCVCTALRSSSQQESRATFLFYFIFIFPEERI